MNMLDFRSTQTDEEWEAQRPAREKRTADRRYWCERHERERQQKEAYERQRFELRRYGHRFVNYQKYLKSPKWQALRQMVFERCGGICEACKANDMTATHHITYRNLGDEKPWQLLGVCERCHETIHGIRRIPDGKPKTS